MGLQDIVRKGVAIADKVTKTLQVEVTHKRWIETDADGNDVLEVGGVLREAVVEFKTKFLRKTGGGGEYNASEETIQRAVITIIGPVEPFDRSGRENPIDPRDQFILPDGSSGPILNIVGVVDPETGAMYAPEISLGT